MQIKINACITALNYIKRQPIIGIGTGSTIDLFIEQIALAKLDLKVVSSSKKTNATLKKFNIPIIPWSETIELPLYIDSADAYNDLKQLIKGKGGAQTQEKILAYNSKFFVCIVDQNKSLLQFNKMPIPIEVLSVARGYVARNLIKLGGKPVYRDHFITDNNNIILDTYDLSLHHPIELEKQLNNIPGIVSNGIFAVRPADLIIVGTKKDSLLI